MSPSESGRTHPREKEVFLKALEIRDRVARDKFIASVSGNDEVLRKRVERLLRKVLKRMSFFQIRNCAE